MRALRKLRSWRPLRGTLVAMTGAIVVVAMSASFAGTAAADAPGTPGETPISGISGQANHINVLGPYEDAIPAGTSGAAANWAADVNDNPSLAGLTTWTTGDVLTIDVTPVGGQAAQLVSSSSYVEFDGTPAVIVEGGASGETAPTIGTPTVTENPADVSNDTGLTDQLNIPFTNSSGPNGLTPFTLAILNIKYTVGALTAMGAIHAFGAYTHNSVAVPITVDPNAAVADIYATANTPAVSVLPGAISALISPISVVETAPGIVTSDPVVGDTLITSVGYICVQAVSGKFVGSPTISVSPSSVGGEAAVTGVVSILNPPLAAGSTLVAQVTESSTTVPTTFTFSDLEVDAINPTTGVPLGTGPVQAIVTYGNNSTCTGGTPVVIPGNPVYGLSTNGSGDAQITIYSVGTGHGPTGDAPIFGSTAPQTAVASLEYQFPVTPGGVCVTNNANPRSRHIGSTAVVTDDLPGGLDGLTAAALAGYVGSGVLFTGYGSTAVDPYTMAAIAQEGFTSVDIVGGTLAVTAAAATELANTPSYFCGGSIERTNALGTPETLQVHRIGGIDAATTAELVADTVNSGGPIVANLNISGAFSGGWNQTLGSQSTSPVPNTPLRTVFLVTSASAADASSVSAESYAMGIPILVTEGVNSLGVPAQTGLLDLGAQNVIIAGGNLAVANSVSSTLLSEGYNVLRLAGTDLTQTSVDVAEWALDTDTTSAGQPLGLGWGELQFPDECSSIATASVGVESNPGSTVYDCDVTVGLATGAPSFGFSDAESSSTVDGNEFIPLLLTDNASTLGTYVTTFFNEGGSPFGVDSPANPTDPFVPWQGEVTDTILPFGGPIALNPTTVQAALNAVSAGYNPT